MIQAKTAATIANVDSASVLSEKRFKEMREIQIRNADAMRKYLRINENHAE
jgi:hypothetical protein